MTGSRMPTAATARRLLKSRVFHAIFAAALVTAVLFLALRDRVPEITHYRSLERLPRVEPDYDGAVIPPNIAPLNLVVEQDGSAYLVKIHSEQGEPIEVFSKERAITIPVQPWRALLDANRGRQLSVDVYVEAWEGASSSGGSGGAWSRFAPLTVLIAREDIDPVLVYRRIRPGHGTWRDMGIYSRDLGSFRESTVLDNGYFKEGCVNCHTFCSNRPETALIGIRSSDYGNSALLIEGDRVRKIGSPFGYSSWHPSGKVVAFSVNKVRQFFHSAASEVRDVIDLESRVSYYLVDQGVVKTTPDLASEDRLETYPAWSADGRHLYFCSAPVRFAGQAVSPEIYGQVKYDLVRVAYDVEHDRWGPLETVLSSEATGLSILQPRISPDGRWLLFCMCDYGCFPVYQPSSDLYLMDLATIQQAGGPTYRRLDINSDEGESWHCWSSEGRWIAFSSKRGSGVFTRIYLAYVDESGSVRKPIRLPQEDPTYYQSCLWTYSVLELVTGPVRATRETLGRVVRGSEKISVTR